MNTLYEHMLRLGYTAEELLDESYDQHSTFMNAQKNRNPHLEQKGIDAFNDSMLNLTLAQFLARRDSVYPVNEFRFHDEFLHHLLSTNLKDIKMNAIPWDRFARTIFYFDAPKGIKLFSGMRDGYSLVMSFMPDDEGALTANVVMSHWDKDADELKFSNFPIRDIKESDQTIDQFAKFDKHDYGSKYTPDQMSVFNQEIISLFNNLVKMLLYVCSGNPDLRLQKASKIQIPKQGSKKAWKKFLHKAENKFIHDITMVGYEYMKQRLYHKDSTYRNTFPRWQPCGPGRSQVKLVWVKGHQVHYKNTRTKLLSQNSNEKIV